MSTRATRARVGQRASTPVIATRSTGTGALPAGPTVSVRTLVPPLTVISILSSNAPSTWSAASRRPPMAASIGRNAA